jgi:hypothetical protein
MTPTSANFQLCIPSLHVQLPPERYNPLHSPAGQGRLHHPLLLHCLTRCAGAWQAAETKFQNKQQRQQMGVVKVGTECRCCADMLTPESCSQLLVGVQLHAVDMKQDTDKSAAQLTERGNRTGP